MVTRARAVLKIPAIPVALSGAVKQALPIVLGYVPVGFAFGVLALKNGISPVNAVLMSVIVFAGSAQLIAVGLIGAGAAPLSVIATTFVVNLRHVLMAASLAPFLSSWRKRSLAWFGMQLTDETFAVHSVRFHRDERDRAETFGINAIAQLGWVGGSWLGVAASTVISDVRPLGLDYALPAMFIALVVAQVKDTTHVLVGLVAAVLSLTFLEVGVGQWNVILATVAGASLGTGVATWTRR
ncbi:AzlC family ABC transporter permease [Desulfovibrio ferrophilus]|uniref:AzlC family protein n=1 Tax=Desulfovibrio ferrophilus TaxID=241368 RepID=A0A2Z6B382_9BACT|nr:AzlC family ABC transporter permease [Desulfovibrio ferrophilus]BBD09898.1 AzlC family protein [Desulfovibrio ferrophilus]